MSEDQIKVAAGAVLSVSAYRNPVAAQPLADDLALAHPSPVRPAQAGTSQPRRSNMRQAFNHALRQVYGLFKLASAPREALRLNAARSGTALARLVAEPGRKEALASQPFVCAKWSSAQRLRAMIEHCAVVDKLGHPFDIFGDEYVEIVKFDLDGEPCRLMLDQPKWLACDGMLCLSLWAGFDRVFSVSFSLADGEDGRTAYIGGIQGQRSSDSLDHNRILTKAAHGMRPRDLAFELFRMLTPHMGVTQLKCVADAWRYQMTRRATMTIGLNDKVQLDYNDVWESRGGVLGDDGFYLVPTAYSRHDIADIPTKKRSMYRKRYAMLDDLESAIGLALQAPCVVHCHAPRARKSLTASA
jgi:uncharacterized protein VirK/YbjX